MMHLGEQCSLSAPGRISFPKQKLATGGREGGGGGRRDAHQGIGTK